MEEDHDKLSNGRRSRQIPLRTLLNKGALGVGAVTTAATVAITGCSGPPQSPADIIVTTDCKTLTGNLSQALVDLAQTVGGNVITHGTVGSATAVDQAAQQAAQNDFSARRVPSGEPIIVDPSYGPQYEASATIDGFDALVDCDELTGALDSNLQDPQFSNTAATEAVETTLSAAVVVGGLTNEANKFAGLSAADKTAIAKANVPLRAAVSMAAELQRDGTAAGIRIPKRLQVRV
jgi:hypothetical protein